MVGTFWGKKSLKALSNKVFRFIQQALINYCLSVVPSLPTIIDEFRREDKEFY